MSNERMIKHRQNNSNNKNNNIQNDNNSYGDTNGFKRKNSNDKTNYNNREINNNELKHSLTEVNINKLNNNDKKNKKEKLFAEEFHQVRDSLLTSASGFSNYRGILNLCVVLLVMSTSRLVIENIIKYGVLVRFDILILFIKDPTAWPSALAIVCSNIFILFSLWLEKKLEKSSISETVGGFLFIGNISTALVLPAVYLWYRETNPIASFFALAFYTCVFMKLVSYYQVNKELRADRKLNKYNKKYYNNNKKNRSLSPKMTKKIENNNTQQMPVTASINSNKTEDPQHSNLVQSIETFKNDNNNNNNNNKEDYDEEVLSHSPQPLVYYPNNLNLKDMYYFIAVPTLCYEINFPRTSRIRKRFLIKRITEIAFLITLQIMLMQQWVVPILQNSKDPFRESNILKIIERVLKLAVPNHVLWLIGFYALFHSYLNILAELLRFGDRQFYKDWWNSETVGAFWKNWNIPVHSFCSRHIYRPLMTQGLTKMQASLIVFFISAFFHEYIVSIPLRMFRLWAFFGMLLQVPFSMFVSKYLHGHYGNMAVWVSLIIGQPAAIMMYIHDYYIDYFRNSN